MRRKPQPKPQEPPIVAWLNSLSQESLTALFARLNYNAFVPIMRELLYEQPAQEPQQKTAA